MLDSHEIRSRFLTFFQTRDHTVVRSSSIVPLNDPTLLFTNAGMVQFKDVFTGVERRDYKRATTAQKCVRAGGKHNDLENVGRTARHHTFFEMLGNFSFGDYFKADAIRFAWELLTQDYGIAPDRLTVTVFGGEPGLAVPADEEARVLWQQISGLPDDRILGLGAKDNFWQMGDTGPCGPCSEIHFHQGDDLPCAEAYCKGAACDCDRWLEIWNLVFMQFERAPSGALTPLPAPSVDTGMGLERLAAVLQGKRSNYETDLFAPIIREVELVSRKRFDPVDYDGESVSMRAISDHARATAFLMADGVLPEKTGREYVLRRIMRRAIYHGWLLGIEEPFLHRVTNVVIEQMQGVYPELLERRATIQELTQAEERKFRETLDRGMTILEGHFSRMGEDDREIPGELAFRLYDTFGFPLDLTQVIAETRGREVDLAGYDAAMEQQRRRSTFAGSGEEAVDDVYKSLRSELGATEFLGYEATEAEATVVGIVVGNQRVTQTGPGPVAFVTDRTPFYGEQGGQVGDTGESIGSGSTRVRIDDTRKPGGDLTVHVGEMLAGELRVGDQVRLSVDVVRRDRIRKNHSATHLVHRALREVLGEHVAQRGSVVAPDRLRFDFSHTRPLDPAQQQRVEQIVNESIWRNDSVGTQVLPIERARESGAIAFFGEKYGDEVRVVAMGDSREFCGGTHVRATGDIGLFKIVEETGIAQGVRRIVAVTGPGALEYVQRIEGTLAEVAERVRATGPDVVEKVDRLREEQRALQRQIADLQKKVASGSASSSQVDVREIDGLKVATGRTDEVDRNVLRQRGDALRDQQGADVVALAGVRDGSVALLVMVKQDKTDRVNAGRILQEIAPLVGGKGGGQPHLAQGGGGNPGGVDAALARVYEVVV